MEASHQRLYCSEPSERCHLTDSFRPQCSMYPSTGFPADNIQAYELYNSKPQLYARTHISLLNTQKALLSLWHSSGTFPASIDFTTPISYFDRLRIRTPGDRSFTLGPHIDGGSVERWEDTVFRRVWTKIFCGGEGGWETFDPFDATWRVNARQDLYNAPYVLGSFLSTSIHRFLASSFVALF